MKKYLIFDLDGTLIKSMDNIVNFIIERLSNVPWTDIEKVKYVLKTTAWKALIDQLAIIYEDKSKKELYDIMNYIYEGLEQFKFSFFEWAIEKIKELNKKYKLFLTTWNSTSMAREHLKKWKILDCFELVYGSDKIPKWHAHLEDFKEHTNDNNFYEEAVYIWDGDQDRIFAKEKNIDFIHIWNDWKDTYEITSVIYIDEILNNLSQN